VEFTTVIWAGERVLMKPFVRCDVPAERERRTRMRATPTTIPETVNAVRSRRLRRLLTAIPMDEDMIFLGAPFVAWSESLSSRVPLGPDSVFIGFGALAYEGSA